MSSPTKAKPKTSKADVVRTSLKTVSSKASAKPATGAKSKTAVKSKLGATSVVAEATSLKQSPVPTPIANIPLSRAFIRKRNVLFVPWGNNEPSNSQRAAGLFDENGDYIAEAECQRYLDMPITIEPEFDTNEPEEFVEGRYLFGGLLYGHFGHFLVESTARLWATAHEAGLDGVVWLPKPTMSHPFRLVKPYLPFMSVLGLSDLKLIAPQKNTRVEEVVIAEQGFGIGEFASGRPEYRAFMRERLTSNIAAEGPEKLYVSRSELISKRGSVLMEQRIEALMEAEGYEIFHPQHHTIDVQIARYMAAKMLVGLDGSALHLAAMVLGNDVKVAIINRGPTQSIDDYERQLEAFAGITPVKIEAIRAYWFEENRRVVKRETHALLDLSAVGRALHDAGMIQARHWPDITETELDEALDQRQKRAGIVLQRYEI